MIFTPRIFDQCQSVALIRTADVTAVFQELRWSSFSGIYSFQSSWHDELPFEFVSYNHQSTFDWKRLKVVKNCFMDEFLCEPSSRIKRKREKEEKTNNSRRDNARAIRVSVYEYWKLLPGLKFFFLLFLDESVWVLRAELDGQLQLSIVIDQSRKMVTSVFNCRSLSLLLIINGRFSVSIIDRLIFIRIQVIDDVIRYWND